MPILPESNLEWCNLKYQAKDAVPSGMEGHPSSCHPFLPRSHSVNKISQSHSGGMHKLKQIQRTTVGLAGGACIWKHSFLDYDMTKPRVAQRQHPFLHIKSVVTSLRLPSPDHYALSPRIGRPPLWPPFLVQHMRNIISYMEATYHLPRTATVTQVTVGLFVIVSMRDNILLRSPHTILISASKSRVFLILVYMCDIRAGFCNPA